MATALARPGMDQIDPSLSGVDATLAWLQQQYAIDPQGTQARIEATPALAYRFHIRNGGVEYEEPGGVFMRHPWLLGALGAAGGIGGIALAGALAGGVAAGAGGAATGASTAVPAVAGGGIADAGLTSAAAGLGASTAVPTIAGAVPGAVGAAPAGGGLLSGALGAAGKYGQVARDVGGVLSHAAAGSADQRIREANPKIAAAALERRSAMLAALLGGTQDAQIHPANPNIAARTPQITGGLRPSAISPDSRQALIQQLTQPIDINAGAGEKTLGALGLGGSILGAISPYLKR